MGKLVLNKKKKELIERIGIFVEGSGLPPVVARIIGLLLISGKQELTFEEIYDSLEISKSAASNAINLLLRTHKVEYITKPGDRKRYFKVGITQWENILKEKIQVLPLYVLLLKEIQSQRDQSNKESSRDFREFVLFIEFLNKEILVLLRKWENRKRT